MSIGINVRFLLAAFWEQRKLMRSGPCHPGSQLMGPREEAVSTPSPWPSSLLTPLSFDGKAMDPPFKAHSHAGPLPETTVENGVLQTGSCHCGAVTVALNVPPLDSTYPEKIVECNCSICERNAYIWIYPPIPQVSLHAKDPADLVLYHFGRGLINKTFCRKCGVSITNQYRPESEGTEDPDWPDFVKEWVPMAKRLKAVNVRVLDGVDLKALPEAEKSTGGEWPPFYKNP